MVVQLGIWEHIRNGRPNQLYANSSAVGLLSNRDNGAAGIILGFEKAFFIFQHFSSQIIMILMSELYFMLIVCSYRN